MQVYSSLCFQVEGLTFSENWDEHISTRGAFLKFVLFYIFLCVFACGWLGALPLCGWVHVHIRVIHVEATEQAWVLLLLS